MTCIKCGNIRRCSSFPPINYQIGTNTTHGQHDECIKCLSCLLLNQLCNYLKDVLIVACSTLNISQRFSSSPSEIDWINQSELWENRRPANQRCVSEFVCFSACVWLGMCQCTSTCTCLLGCVCIDVSV